MSLRRSAWRFQGFGGFLHAVEHVGSVAGQNEGWFKQTQGKAQARA